jgi:glycosyltransferase involved in cell wall biosynthesis
LDMAEVNAPLFTVVMPCFLGDYRGHVGDSASNKVAKFHRAVGSVLGQAFQHWELVIVVDGCPIADEEAKRYAANPFVQILRIPKQRTWSPEVRNAGLKMARGQYAIYLDADDVYGQDHLATVAAALQEADFPVWGAMDEWVWDKELDQWKNRMVSQLFANKKEHGWHAGTPNIVHRTDVGLLWPPIQFRHPNWGYSREDRAMVAELQARGDPVYIPGTSYFVCHVPGVGGYDL